LNLGVGIGLGIRLRSVSPSGRPHGRLFKTKMSNDPSHRVCWIIVSLE
jgi:hypothetical protein